MPTLIRITMTILVFAAVVYGAMYALVTFLEPAPRPMVERISPSVFKKIDEARQSAAKNETGGSSLDKLKSN